MTKFVTALTTAAWVCGGAHAATIEMDISALSFTDGIGTYALEGNTTFLFDTTTQVISGVNVISPSSGVTYTSGTWDLGEIDLSSAGTFKINIDPFVDIATLEALAVGENFTNFPAGDEVDTDPGSSFFSFINGGSITATRLADIGGEIPLPASLPLLLGGIGAMAVMRRTKRTA